MSIICKINASETIPVRHAVLRKGKPIASCHFEGDELPATQHFGLSEQDKIIGVISVFEKKLSGFTDENQAQMRGMAVLQTHQKMGFGKLLVEHCEQELRCQGVSLIWFNARENAVGFYERLGYHTIGNAFMIEGIGPHYVMYKKINH